VIYLLHHVTFPYIQCISGTINFGCPLALASLPHPAKKHRNAQEVQGFRVCEETVTYSQWTLKVTHSFELLGAACLQCHVASKKITILDYTAVKTSKLALQDLATNF
jgi:hypothetical protein